MTSETRAILKELSAGTYCGGKESLAKMANELLPSNPDCNYCGKETERISGDQLYAGRIDLAHRQYLVCRPCDARVGCHDNGIPLGNLANKELRRARMDLHSVFDTIWRDGHMTRGDAYEWLAEQMGVKYVHISQITFEECHKAIALVNTWRPAMGRKTESFCWCCQRQLLPKKGGGHYFSVVMDPLGNRHRVHKDCLEPSVKEGNRAEEANDA